MPPAGQLWFDYVDQGAGITELMALQGLQGVSQEHPDEPVRMVVELQFVLEPYFEGRAVSHLLFKIARCDTGAMEMVRDFFQEYFLKDSQHDPRLLAVKEIAAAA